jgi:hypothetical protein
MNAIDAEIDYRNKLQRIGVGGAIASVPASFTGIVAGIFASSPKIDEGLLYAAWAIGVFGGFGGSLGKALYEFEQDTREYQLIRGFAGGAGAAGLIYTICDLFSAAILGDNSAPTWIKVSTVGTAAIMGTAASTCLRIDLAKKTAYVLTSLGSGFISSYWAATQIEKIAPYLIGHATKYTWLAIFSVAALLPLPMDQRNS